MPETFPAARAAELAVVERNGFVESRHAGSAVVLSPDGTEAYALGDPDAPILPRSALKPFQALASVRSGAPLDAAQTALACGSHTGTPAHREAAARILAAAGMSEADLQCPEAWPGDEASRVEAIRSGAGTSRLAFNCSGKHAAFLAACAASGWDPGSYLDPGHPLQRAVAEAVEEYAGTPIAHTATDGCGAPAPALPLRGLARAVSRLAAAPGRRDAEAAAAGVATAMLDHPWAVQGPGRDNTVVLEELGVLAKLGAEGVLVLGAPDGTACALKMLDGRGRASTLVGLTLLAAAGAVDVDRLAPVLERLARPVLGGGRPVGRIRLAAPVVALLD